MRSDYRASLGSLLPRATDPSSLCLTDVRRAFRTKRFSVKVVLSLPSMTGALSFVIIMRSFPYQSRLSGTSAITVSRPLIPITLLVSYAAIRPDTSMESAEEVAISKSASEYLEDQIVAINFYDLEAYGQTSGPMKAHLRRASH